MSKQVSKETDKALFLAKLQTEAALQARLETQRLLPSSLDTITSYIGRYAWQILLVTSGLVSLGIELWQK
ncbi:MAG: hypothetical protein WDZ94_05265 [Patescibacteria group bacterium]